MLPSKYGMYSERKMHRTVPSKTIQQKTGFLEMKAESKLAFFQLSFRRMSKIRTREESESKNFLRRLVSTFDSRDGNLFLLVRVEN